MNINVEISISELLELCREIMCKKIATYSNTPSFLNPITFLDLSFAKLYRIRAFLLNKKMYVKESIIETITSVINYTLLFLYYYEKHNQGSKNLLAFFDETKEKINNISNTKNKDYDYAWMYMEALSLIEIATAKVFRIKNMMKTNNNNYESIYDNAIDIINYTILFYIKYTMEDSNCYKIN